MKKLFLSIFIVLLLASVVTAQNTEGGKSSDSSIGVKTGADFALDVPLGPIADYVGIGYGGGIICEIGIPLPFKNISAFANNFAIGIKGNFIYNTTVSDYLADAKNVQIYVTALSELPFPKAPALTVVPEVGVGVLMNLLNASDKADSELKPIYVDQLYVFGLGLRYKFDSGIQLALTPYYLLSPANEGMVHQFTCKFAVLYKVK